MADRWWIWKGPDESQKPFATPRGVVPEACEISPYPEHPGLFQFGLVLARVAINPGDVRRPSDIERWRYVLQWRQIKFCSIVTRIYGCEDIFAWALGAIVDRTSLPCRVFMSDGNDASVYWDLKAIEPGLKLDFEEEEKP